MALFYCFTHITIWLFNSSPWKITILLIGKPSISMGHLYHGELLVITRGYIPTIFWRWNMVKSSGKTFRRFFSAASSTFSDFTCEGFRVAARKSVSWILASCMGFWCLKNAAKMLIAILEKLGGTIGFCEVPLFSCKTTSWLPPKLAVKQFKSIES